MINDVIVVSRLLLKIINVLTNFLSHEDNDKSNVDAPNTSSKKYQNKNKYLPPPKSPLHSEMEELKKRLGLGGDSLFRSKIDRKSNG